MKRAILVLTCFVLLYSSALAQSKNRPRRTTNQNTQPSFEDLFADLAKEPDWVEVDVNSEAIEYFNPRRLIRHSTNIVRVWIKSVPKSEEARQRLIKSKAKYHRNYSEYAYMLTLEEYDCRSVRYRLLWIGEYDQAGEVIYNNTINDEWNDLPPDTAGEMMQQKVCAYHK